MNNSDNSNSFLASLIGAISSLIHYVWINGFVGDFFKAFLMGCVGALGGYCVRKLIKKYENK